MEEEIIGNRWKELGGVGHSGKSRMRARDPPPLTSSLQRPQPMITSPLGFYSHALCSWDSVLALQSVESCH